MKLKLDLVLRLREARRLSGLSQKEAARKSGIGEKSISTFETGRRIDAMTVSQLQKLLAAYNLTLEEFHSGAFADQLMLAISANEQAGIARLVAEISPLDSERRERLLTAFIRMVDLTKTNDPRSAGRKG